MNNNLTTRQAAAVLSLNPSRIRRLLADGRIEGAVKHGRDWVIPTPVRVLPPKRERSK
jgi:excisionase family DNA binding protein